MGLARSVTSDGDESRTSANRLHASTIPDVQDGERPTAYADRVGEWYVSRRSSQQRKDHGLFLTPVAAADFMARQIAAKSAKVRVLDPRRAPARYAARSSKRSCPKRLSPRAFGWWPMRSTPV